MTGTLNTTVVADGLNFPTSLAFDDAGTMYVAESGLPFGGAPPGGRVWRLDPGGGRAVMSEGFAPPVNGLTHHRGELFVSVGGHPSGILAVDLDGSTRTVVAGLPGPGNYQTNMAVVGTDQKLYFSQGAMTNSGIIGMDSYEIGWLARLPHSHDLPGFDVVLTGVNVATPNPLSPADGGDVETGAFVPFATPTTPGQSVPAQLPCTAAVMRCELDGSGLELVAWGLRNAYGLGFLPDGRLLAIDQGADDRGSRPIGNAPDLLYEVRPGWYGWPDFIGSEPVTAPRFRPERGASPSFLLANHDELPPPQPPLMSFGPHSAAVKFDVGPPGLAYGAGDLFVALFGDEVPMTAPSGPRVGRRVVRVDLAAQRLHPVPAGPFARPIDVRFSPDGVLHVLDFGHFEMTPAGVQARPGTGKVYRLSPG